jgi:cell division septal protein FtsQ
VLAVVSCAGLAFGSLYSPLFAVRHVRVQADGRVATAAVVAAAGLQHHPLMIDVDSARVAARLDADPLLGGARVSRHWPSSVYISVDVRSPVAAVPGAGGFAEVDATGRVLALSADRPPGLPLLAGAGIPPAPGGWLPGSAGPGATPPAGSEPYIDASSGAPGSGMSLEDAALAFLGSVPAVLRPAIESATIPPNAGISSHGVTLNVVSPRDPSQTLQVYLGDGSAMPAKVASFVTMLDEANLSGVSVIDLTVPSRPVTQPAGA